MIAACPGFTSTEFLERANVREQSIPGGVWIEAQDVVAAALSDAVKGRPTIVATGRYETLSVLMQSAPRPLVRTASGARRVRRRPQR